MSEENFLNQLNELLSLANDKQRNVAEMLEISTGYVSQLLSGKREPSPQIRRLLEIKLAEMKNPSPMLRQGKTPSLQGKRPVPVVSWALAGHADGGLGHFEDLANQIEDTAETDSRDPNAFAIEIAGNSMEPDFWERDYVVFEPNREAVNGWPALVKTRSGKVFFKYFYRTGPEGKTVRLESAHREYPPMFFAAEDILWAYPARNSYRRVLARRSAVELPHRESPEQSGMSEGGKKAIQS